MAVLLAVFVAQCVLSMRLKSPTFDEVGHLPAGYTYLVKNDYRLYPVNPPLIKQWAALPLLFLDIEAPFGHTAWQNAQALHFGKQLLYFSNNPADLILFLGRSMIVLLGVILGYFVYRWARELFGAVAGLFALLLFVFEPNILAHARLATTDLGFATFAFIAVYYFSRYVQQPQRRTFILAVLTLGLAFASKFTAVLLMPAFFLIGLFLISAKKYAAFEPAVVRRLIPARYHLRQGASLLLLLCLLVVLAHVVVMFDYGLVASPLVRTSNGVLRLELLLEKMPILGAEFLREKIVTFAHEIPIPGREYFSNLLNMLGFMPKLAGENGEAPYARYLLGKTSHSGFWYFPLLAFFIKEPIAIILLVCASLVLLRRGDWRGKMILLIPVAIFFLAGIKAHSFAYRYVNLPALPFMLVLAGSVVAHPPRLKMVRIGAGVLAVWLVFGTMRIYPHYLAYFNDAVGGADNGYKYMVNSNFDWGQDLKLLKKYLDAHDIQQVKLAYFGTAVPEYYGIRYEPLQGVSEATFDPAIEEDPAAATRADSGTIAISATCLQNIGGFYPGASYDWLKKHQPVAKIGYTIFIYHLPERLPARRRERKIRQ